jgi:hypothetical protein
MNRKETHADMSYSIPPIGTVLPAKQNVDPTIPNPGPTTNAVQFNQWAQAQAQDEAFNQNKQAVAQYAEGFQSWLTQTYPFQPNPDLAPPQPPAALVVLAAPAEAAPVDFQIVQSGDSVTVDFTPADGSGPTYTTGPLIPVCAVPTYAKIAGPNDPSKNKIAQPTEKHGHHKKP